MKAAIVAKRPSTRISKKIGRCLTWRWRRQPTMRRIADVFRTADLPAGLLALLAFAVAVIPSTWVESHRGLLIAAAIALTVAYLWFAIRGRDEQAGKAAKTAALLAHLDAKREMSPIAINKRVITMRNCLNELDYRACNDPSQDDWKKVQFGFWALREELVKCLDDLESVNIADSWLSFYQWMPRDINATDRAQLHSTAEKFKVLADRFAIAEMKR